MDDYMFSLVRSENIPGLPFIRETLERNRKRMWLMLFLIVNLQMMSLFFTLFYLLQKNFVPFELKDGERFCFYGHPSTYFKKQQCIYKLNEDGILQPCINRKHLEFCTDFNCRNVKPFKCPGYYFIPMKYVCDGKIDCPKSQDEVECANYT